MARKQGDDDMTRAMQYRIFWLELATLVDAGLPVLRALNMITSPMSDDDKFNAGIKKIRYGVQTGQTLSEAMGNSGMFSDCEVNIVKAGEICGMLEVSLNRLASGRLDTRARQYEGFYQNLSMLLTSGVPILQSLRISRRNLDESLQSAVDKILENVKNGELLSGAMAESGEFSALEISLVEIGEETGSLDSMLMRLANMNRSFKFD